MGTYRVNVYRGGKLMFLMAVRARDAEAAVTRIATNHPDCDAVLKE